MASAPAPAAAAPAASAEAAKNDVLFKEDSTKTPGEPSKKKRRLELRVDQDPSLKRILTSVVGTRAQKFKDGLVYDSTLECLKALWMKMDFVEQGVLKQINFQSVRGIDPVWEELLESCDVDGDGNITPSEFIAGFVFAALEKPMSVQMPVGSTVTGIEVMKSLQAVLNQHLMNEVEYIRKGMGW